MKKWRPRQTSTTPPKLGIWLDHSTGVVHRGCSGYIATVSTAQRQRDRAANWLGSVLQCERNRPLDW